MRYFIIVLLISSLAACQSGKKCSPDGKCCAPKEELPKVDYDQKLADMSITLSKPGTPQANYLHARQSGNMLYLSGKGPGNVEGSITGKVGADLTVAEGYEAARRCGINHLSVLKDHLGDLNRVKQFVKVLGMVNSAPDFTGQSQVVNGYSDLIVEVFGDRGQHARSAVGMGALPGGIATEVEVIVELYPER